MLFDINLVLTLSKSQNSKSFEKNSQLKFNDSGQWDILKTKSQITVYSDERILQTGIK